MKLIRTLLPHAAIVFSLLFITFFIVDKINGAMNFINNNITKGMLLACALVSIANACFLIADNRRRARRRMRKDSENSGHTIREEAEE